MLGHGRHERLIDRLFSDDRLTADEWRSLFHHLDHESCARCNQRYQQKRAEAGGPAAEDGPAPAVAASMMAVLDERANALLGERPAPAAAPPRRAIARRSWFAIAGLAAVAAGALVVVPQLAPVEDDQPRLKSDWQPSADFYCEAAGARRLLTLPGAPCAAGGRVVVETQLNARRPFVTLVTCAGGLSCQIAEAQTGPAGKPIELRSPTLAGSGELELFAVWSSREVTGSQVTAAIDRLRSRRKCAHEVDALPLVISDGNEQLSFSVRLQP